MSQSLPDCDSGDRSQEKQAMCKIYSGSGDIQYLVAMMAGESAMAPSPQGMASVQQQWHGFLCGSGYPGSLGAHLYSGSPAFSLIFELPTTLSINSFSAFVTCNQKTLPST